MLTSNKRKVLFWLSVTVFVVMMPIVIMYALGYRLDENFQLKKTGGIYISSDITGSEIFLDSELMKKTNLLQDGVFIDNLSPRTYEIIVLNEGYLEWSKKLKVSSQLVTEAKALLIPNEVNSEILLSGTFSDLNGSDIDEILLFGEEKSGSKIIRWYLPRQKQFLSDTGSLLKYNNSLEVIRWIPSGAILKLDAKVYRIQFDLGTRTARAVPIGNELPQKSDEEQAQANLRENSERQIVISYDNNGKRLSAKWTGKNSLPYYFSNPEEMLIENKEIRNFEFYPARNDVVLSSFDNGIFAIEIDGRDKRHIQPIYKGRAPDFVLLPGSEKIYALDGGILIEIALRAE